MLSNTNHGREIEFCKVKVSDHNSLPQAQHRSIMSPQANNGNAWLQMVLLLGVGVWKLRRWLQAGGR